MADADNVTWSWTRVTKGMDRPDRGSLAFTAVGGSDYWRLTASGIAVHNGHSLVTSVIGDFDLSACFSAQLSTRYDQVGLIVLGSETDWYKTNYERDGDLCVGGVRTRGDSDWSRALVPALGELRVARQGDVIESFSRPDTAAPWTMIRQFRMDGPVAVGIYGASPMGEGFDVDVSRITLTVNET